MQICLEGLMIFLKFSSKIVDRNAALKIPKYISHLISQSSDSSWKKMKLRIPKRITVIINFDYGSLKYCPSFIHRIYIKRSVNQN